LIWRKEAEMTGIRDGVGQLELFDFCYRDVELISPPGDVFPHSICSTPTEDSTYVEPITKCCESKSGTRFLEKVLCRLSAMDFPGKDYVREYLQHLYRRNCKFSTLRGSLTAAQLFLSFVEGCGKSQVEQVGKQDIEAFVEHEQDRGLSIVTVKTRLASIYAFLRYMVDRGVVDPEVLVKKIRLRLPDVLPKAINPEDIKRLVSVVDKVRDRAMILLLLRTGMRIGELLDTKVSDINIDERKIAIYEGEKNRMGRVVYVSDDALWALRAWLRDRDPHKQMLFYAWSRDTITYAAARYMFVKYTERAGLAHKGYTLHCLRHTYASELLNAGMPLECLQQLLGHNSADVTRRYARLTDRTREDEYFKAMAIIERGDLDGDYQLDS
jgi:integrase/recombinase XerD